MHAQAGKTRTRDPRGYTISGKGNKRADACGGSTNRAIRRESRKIIADQLAEAD